MAEIHLVKEYARMDSGSLWFSMFVLGVAMFASLARSIAQLRMGRAGASEKADLNLALFQGKPAAAG